MQFLRYWAAALSEVFTPLWKVCVLGSFLFGFWTAIIDRYEWWQNYAAPGIAIGFFLGVVNLVLRLLQGERSC